MAVTRAEVARLAGTSPAIVSYVLNGSRPVSPRTRKAVEDAVKELGYTPNRAALSLRGRASTSLGLLVPDQGNPFFAEVAEALEDAAFAKGYVLLLGNAMGDTGRESRYLHNFVQRQVDGVVVISLSPEVAIDEVVDSIPVVVLDRVSEGSRVSSVVADHAEGARLATDHLLDHGRQAVACLAGPEHVPSARLRVAGWRGALVRTGGDLPSSFLLSGDFSMDSGHAMMSALLEDPRSAPDGVFVSSDVQAIGALRGCREKGVRVPDDIAVASFDGTRLAQYLTPTLTTVRQPIARMAASALDRLIESIGSSKDSAVTRDEVLDVDLITRESCGCALPRHGGADSRGVAS